MGFSRPNRKINNSTPYPQLVIVHQALRKRLRRHSSIETLDHIAIRQMSYCTRKQISSLPPFAYLLSPFLGTTAANPIPVCTSHADRTFCIGRSLRVVSRMEAVVNLHDGLSICLVEEPYLWLWHAVGTNPCRANKLTHGVLSAIKWQIKQNLCHAMYNDLQGSSSGSFSMPSVRTPEHQYSSISVPI